MNEHSSKFCGRTKVIYCIQAYDGTIGYVGQTSNQERRFARHLDPVYRKPRNVDKWIAKVGGVNFGILETCDWCLAKQKEIEWKRKLKPVVPD